MPGVTSSPSLAARPRGHGRSVTSLRLVPWRIPVFAARLRSICAAVALAVVAAVAGVSTIQSSAGAADDPLYVPWPELLPGLTDGYDPGSSNVCVAGKAACIDA